MFAVDVKAPTRIAQKVDVAPKRRPSFKYSLIKLTIPLPYNKKSF